MGCAPRPTQLAPPAEHEVTWARRVPFPQPRGFGMRMPPDAAAKVPRVEKALTPVLGGVGGRLAGDGGDGKPPGVNRLAVRVGGFSAREILVNPSRSPRMGRPRSL
jgi:hypothetical protein